MNIKMNALVTLTILSLLSRHATARLLATSSCQGLKANACKTASGCTWSGGSCGDVVATTPVPTSSSTPPPTPSPINLTHPNCPTEATSCKCTDGTTSCSVDQECPGTITEVSGTCNKGSAAGEACSSNLQCPKGQGYAECVGGGTIEEPPAEGSCLEITYSPSSAPSVSSMPTNTCYGVQVSSGLIAGDIDKCSEGFLCGDFTKNTNPVDCVTCLPDMTCDTWCNLYDNLGHWTDQPLESYMANSICEGNGYDACTCTMSSWYSNSHSITTNTHPGAICDAHQFDRYDSCSTEGWCLQDYPDESYCNTLKVTAITGELDTVNGVCTCNATVTSSDDPSYSENKAVWSSECIENLYLYNLTGFVPQSVLLPCNFIDGSE